MKLSSITLFHKYDVFGSEQAFVRGWSVDITLCIWT